MSLCTNPFEVLGLPARRDLADAQVDAAWRAVAVATHPDRQDGGDLARYTQASAAFAELRVPWSRSEEVLHAAGRRPGRRCGLGARLGYRGRWRRAGGGRGQEGQG